jgi:dimethylargininase
VLLVEALAQHEAFADCERLVVDADEEYAANAVRSGERVLLPTGYPRTFARIAALGLAPVALAMGEFRKMDGGLSCLSLRWCRRAPKRRGLRCARPAARATVSRRAARARRRRRR